jgi:hypothetical protein
MTEIRFPANAKFLFDKKKTRQALGPDSYRHIYIAVQGVRGVIQL